MLGSFMSTLCKIESFTKIDSIEKIPPIDWPVDKSMMHFLLIIDEEELSFNWEGGPRVYKKTD